MRAQQDTVVRRRLTLYLFGLLIQLSVFIGLRTTRGNPAHGVQFKQQTSCCHQPLCLVPRQLPCACKRTALLEILGGNSTGPHVLQQTGHNKDRSLNDVMPWHTWSGTATVAERAPLSCGATLAVHAAQAGAAQRGLSRSICDVRSMPLSLSASL